MTNDVTTDKDRKYLYLQPEITKKIDKIAGKHYSGFSPCVEAIISALIEVLDDPKLMRKLEQSAKKEKRPIEYQIAHLFQQAILDYESEKEEK